MSGRISHYVPVDTVSKALRASLVAVIVGVLAAGCGAPAAPAPTAAPAAKAPAAPAAAKIGFPEKGKTLNIIIPAGAGGAGDVIARQLSPGLERALGIPVQVVNKPGGSDLVGLTEVATSKPDGYSISLISQPTISTLYMDPVLKSPIQRKDLTPIANFERHSNITAGGADGKFKTLKDLVDTAKAKPRTVRAAISGKVGTGAMVAYRLADLTKSEFLYVSFNSGAETVTAVIGGSGDFCTLAPSQIAPQIKGGKMVGFAVTGTEEKPVDAPGVKPFKDQGIDMAVYNTQGFIGPAGIPRDIVNLLSAAIKTTVEDPEVVTKLAASGNVVFYQDAATYDKAWDEFEQLAKVGLDYAAKVQ